MCAVAFVMQITEMNEAMSRLVVRQAQPANFDPLRLDPPGISHHHARSQKQCGQNKLAAADFVEFHWQLQNYPKTEVQHTARIASGILQR
jgi:hypothetical protein